MNVRYIYIEKQGPAGPKGDPGEIPEGLQEILADPSTVNAAGLRLVANETGGLDLAIWNQTAGKYQRVRIIEQYGLPTLAFAELIP